MKTIQTAKKTLKQIEKEITDDTKFITGSIKDLKKLGLDQSSEVLGVKVKPDSELVELKDFKTRQELDDYIKDLLGDNLTLNRLNSHRLIGEQKDFDRLQLSHSSSVWGVKIK